MQTLDFNSIELPRLAVIFRDEARTRVTVKTPTLAMIEKLQANRKTLNETLRGEGDGAIAATYDMIAEFISHNEEGTVITGADLREKYGWADLGCLVVFMQAYLSLIETIQNAKN